jgi:hypothetical protein
MIACDCSGPHPPRRVVLTGGPGAGKTATLELVRQALCPHVHVLQEAAGILFAGGFPRAAAPLVRRAAQRAIFFTQRELEAIADAGDPRFLAKVARALVAVRAEVPACCRPEAPHAAP